MLKEEHAITFIWVLLFLIVLTPFVVWVTTPQGKLGKIPLFSEEVIIPLLILIIIILLYILGHIRSKAYDFSPKRGMHFKEVYHGGPVDLVASYVLECRKRKISPSRIRKKLREVGWTDDIIEKAFEKAGVRVRKYGILQRVMRA